MSIATGLRTTSTLVPYSYIRPTTSNMIGIYRFCLNNHIQSFTLSSYQSFPFYLNGNILWSKELLLRKYDKMTWNSFDYSNSITLYNLHHSDLIYTHFCFIFLIFPSSSNWQDRGEVWRQLRAIEKTEEIKR